MSKPSASTTDRSRAPGERLLPLVVFLASVGLSGLGTWQGLDWAFSDWLVKTRISAAPLPQSPRIVPVDLNDRAERNLGDQVDTRQPFLSLFKVLGSGQLTGGMDFLFAGQRNPQVDLAMAQAAGSVSDLVLAVVPVPENLSKFAGRPLAPDEAAVVRSNLWHPKVLDPGAIPRASTFLLPSLAFSKAATHLGHIGVTPDKDGLYRRVPLFYRWEDGYLPSLPLALAADFLKVDLSKVEVRAGSEVLLPLKSGSSIRVPIDDTGSVWIPYPALWDQGWKRVPLDKVVAASETPEGTDQLVDEWSDSLVFAADLTTSHKDFGPTPLEPVYPLSGIHTAVLNGLMTGTFFRPAGRLLGSFEGGILVLGIFFLTGRPKDWQFHLGFGALLVLLTGTVCILWFGGLILPWFVTPAFGLVFAWVSAYGLRLYHAHEHRLLLENALTRYFPRALAARVLNEGRTDLNPASKELTLLFADIVGFTKWSSDKEPDLVHRFLSDYLESMASILFAHGGTVDKFMGDGILAFFGDPFDQPDQTDRCLRAALAMQAKVREIQAVWGPKTGIDLKVRIGINFGPVIVGNLGSQTRIEYTVIGAAVNLAQRMESNAPVNGILVAKAAWVSTADRFVFGETKLVTAKGYDEPVEAYVLEAEKTN